jgi:predicted lipid-binding transport protein (Tim44 family)
MSGFVDIYTVIFLVIAVVVFLRLRSVLGRRTGNERPPYDPFQQRKQAPTAAPDKGGDKVIPLRRPAAPALGTPEVPDGDVIAAAGTPAGDGLAALAAADRSFRADAFLAGAKSAYEMIVTAFAEGDRATLKQLLSKEVYDGFVQAISEREARGEKMEFKFVGIDKADITSAAVKGPTAQVTVRFMSKLVSATHDKAGAVIDGDPTHVGDVTDIWTFAREIAARDPNWKLVATESVD